MVRRLAPGGPGQRAGLKPDDVIERIDGQPVRNFLSWEKAQLDLAPGASLTLTVRRDGGPQDLTLAAVDPPSASAERVNLRDLSLITVTPAIQVERQLAAGRGALVVAAGPSWQNAFGIQPGDVIVRINNYVIGQAEEVSRIVQYLSGRTTLTFWFVRGSQVMAGQAWGTP
jgi:S1-C subfamily serine protease